MLVGQSILKKEREQVFLQNRRQVAAQEQLRIKKVATNGERSAI